MKIQHFNYTRMDGEESERTVIILKEDNAHIEGIDLTKLAKPERQSVIAIQKKYEKALSSFMPSYRKFIKDNIKVL